MSKFDGGGRELLYSTYFGGGITGMAIDSQDRIWLTGESAPPEALPAPAGTPLLGSSYLAALSPDGSTVTSLITAPATVAGQGIVLVSDKPVTLGQGLAAVFDWRQRSIATGNSQLRGISASTAVTQSELVSFYGIGIGPRRRWAPISSMAL